MFVRADKWLDDLPCRCGDPNCRARFASTADLIEHVETAHKRREVS